MLYTFVFLFADFLSVGSGITVKSLEAPDLFNLADELPGVVVDSRAPSTSSLMP